MRKKTRKHQICLINFIKAGLTVLISVLIIFTVVKAGTITPPVGERSAQFYTLTDIRNRLYNNSEATLGDHSFTFSDNLDSTHYTLKQIYDLIPPINPLKLLNDTTYLGITGSIANCSTEGGNACYAASGYWTSLLGANVPGADGSKTFSISDGYYSGKTATCNDTDLVAGNIKKDVTILGELGTLAPSGTVGETDVCGSATFYSGNSWTQKTGSRTACSNSSTDPGESNVYHNTAYNIEGVNKTGTLERACYSTGSAELGTAGNFCGDDTGNAESGNIISGKFAWVDGSKIEGIMTNVGVQTITPGTSNTPITQGYHNGSGYCKGDSNLVAANIGAYIDIFGVSGTLLKYLYNGSASSGDYPQSVGGVDDYNSNGSMPSDSYGYTPAWTDCSSDPYCGADSNADKKDPSTGLIWSKWIGVGADYTQSWFWANNCYYSGTPADCDTNGEAGCKCTKLTGGSKTGCEALGSGWRLPYQKELMQAYINGSWKNLSNAAYSYWSATTISNPTHYSWITTPSTGGTLSAPKTNDTAYRVRCVRP